MHPARLTLDELRSQCQIERTRRGGPGGQHRNKVESAVVITHTPSGTHGEASERRSQAENLDVAWRRLRVQLAIGVREVWQQEQGTSPLWQSRVRGGKLSVSTEHDDFPALLSEALDVLAALAWELPAAAEALKVSNSQLLKFLQQEPAAAAQLNTARRALGLRPLR